MTIQSVINPAPSKQHAGNTFAVSQVVGIERARYEPREQTFAATTISSGGPAANYAKLAEITLPQRTWITEDAYTR
ncbi:hypothetical protein [Rhizobium mesosinicum]|uniref:Uncharacterized protein n=1 Tax=Rhizobium mesosinicum TaxID=335017 RepID=A0ABS7GWU5_9HYPH|nr:hypothetical protein [Rhizobium mesosinicum]MBW9054423.1 hypothetical protein [Rhizobium mesosinicum]